MTNHILFSKIKQQIPNSITSANLFSGCIATYAGFDGQYDIAALFIIIAAILDFFDGFAARMLHAYSPMGKELDSLADVVSFGVAPSAMVFSVMFDTFPVQWHFLSFSAFFIAVFSALRLAKFNIDERQGNIFIGLPTPANALFWASFVVASSNLFTSLHWKFTLVLIAVFCYLLLAEIPMFSLKMKSWKWKDNRTRYIYLILTSLVLISARFNASSLALVIVLYIIFSIVSFYRKKQ
jgi:CDP-diacylglycerol--serine O-phosphatidyltransferase